jgi:hypothetical protein
MIFMQKKITAVYVSICIFNFLDQLVDCDTIFIGSIP